MNPEDVKYHKEHTWVRVEDKKATVGITDYAQESLGDIVYIDAPELDGEVDAGTELTQIESTKATSSVISPVTGTIVKINEDLSDSPEIINEDPYGKGWIAVLDIEDEGQLNGLMDLEAYEKYLEEEVKLK
ncbi:MAG: glycine cleavage system protein GcvH [Thermodesulfovibrionia bacterium]|nr:glycine cleavage system protein GcvH [Thermodesulfovibrionia bacterium]